MSAKAGSTAGIVLGAAMIVAGAIILIVTEGAGAAISVSLFVGGTSMVAGGAIGLAYQPKSASADGEG